MSPILSVIDIVIMSKVFVSIVIVFHKVLHLGELCSQVSWGTLIFANKAVAYPKITLPSPILWISSRPYCTLVG
jgi:hypothetical protein